MKVVVTVFEETCPAAIDAIRAVQDQHDMIEVRAERFPSIDLDAIRSATAKPIILTYRSSPEAGRPSPGHCHPEPAKHGEGSPADSASIVYRRGSFAVYAASNDIEDVIPLLQAGNFARTPCPRLGQPALPAVPAQDDSSSTLHWRAGAVPTLGMTRAAGIDFVDVEWYDGVQIESPERTVISHHDYHGVHDVEAIMAKMSALGCAHTKLAATPHDFAGNERLLALLPPTTNRQPPTTVMGMGERGLYSRILAPFRGSALTFVAASNLAAPGQLTLAQAREIYGAAPQRAERVFAIAGNPAGHSRSPSIHNRLFREKGVPAAYTIASIERFDEITDAFLRGEPCGLSVTAPFKEDAFAFAAIGEVAENARRARAVNTLVNLDGRILADNTDVDGFAALIPPARKAAVIGAGATARAALVALEDAGIPTIVYNRTVSKGDAPLEALRDFEGDLIINTLPAGVAVAIPRCRTYIEAAYAGQSSSVDADVRIGGLELLQAQAVRQHQLFMRVFDGV